MKIIKKKVYKEIPLHSAYRSGILVQKYKEAFKKNIKTKIYIGKTKKVGLARWFKEKWVNQEEKLDISLKMIYRPSKRITKKHQLHTKN